MHCTSSTISVENSEENELRQVEKYLDELDLNQKNIVTISKTSKRLNIELLLTQKIFDYLEINGIIRKKYALLCPDCSHILKTDGNIDNLLVPHYKTCCDDSEFTPTEDDIYLFYEVVDLKKGSAPVKSARDVNFPGTVTQGLQQNIDRDDTLSEYERRRLAQEDAKVETLQNLVDTVNKLTLQNQELTDDNHRKTKDNRIFKWVYSGVVLLCLVAIKILESKGVIDVGNTFTAISFGLPLISVWLKKE